MHAQGIIAASQTDWGKEGAKGATVCNVTSIVGRISECEQLILLIMLLLMLQPVLLSAMSHQLSDVLVNAARLESGQM